MTILTAPAADLIPAPPSAAPGSAHATFAAARRDATAHHIAGIRAHVQALRGMGSRELVATLLREELADTLVEIGAMPAQRRTCPQPLRLAPGTEA